MEKYWAYPRFMNMDEILQARERTYIDGYIQFGRPLDFKINDFQFKQSPRLGRVFFIFLLGTVCILLLLIHGRTVLYLMAPLERLKSHANQLGIDINFKIKNGYGPAVLLEAESALVEMQNKLQSLIDSRTRLLAAISHDLRTSITRAKLKVYFLKDEPLAERLVADLTEMESMINATLSFSENDFLKEKKKNIDISELLAATCDGYVDSGKKVHWKPAQGKRSIFFGSKHALRRCFNHIIDNALNYAGKVGVRQINRLEAIIFEFKDCGEGVSDHKIKDIIKSFYRLRDKDNEPGSGLGLTIVDEIIRDHHGRLTFENDPKGGFIVRIQLPR